MNKFFKSICLIILFLTPLVSTAWDSAGHRIVAEIAYQHLNQKAKHAVNRMVHYMAVEKNGDNQYHYFSDIATWPDDLKTENMQMFSQWHYIDQYFSDDGTPLPTTLPDNVVWAISQMETAVASKNINPYDQARSLAFLVHFVGDVHQPLHTVSRVTKAMPSGDQGGNLYPINYTTEDGYAINELHALWDAAVDLYSEKGFPSFPTDASQIRQLADIIQEDYSESYFGSKVKDLDPASWAKEGLRIAKKDVYQVPEGGAPSDAYLKKNSKIAEKRIALAGYRLAAILNQLLGQRNSESNHVS